MKTQPSADDYPPEEAKRRFETLVRAAINTPPQHRKDERQPKRESNQKAKPPKRPAKSGE